MPGNNTFHGAEPYWANACVGDNGMPDYYDYAKGYSEGSRVLIDAALENSGCNHPVDIMIYPICFNMRHSVELRLKGAVVMLTKMAAPIAPLTPFNLEGSHDIGKIWDFLKREGIKFDLRIEFFAHALDSFIQDIAQIDATGQTFRYPYSNEDVKHLVGVPIINIELLSGRFAALEHLLDSFKEFLVALDEEYRLRTYTKNLSRYQILKIAVDTPALEEWGSKQFSTFKDLVKTEYGIGSKEFSEAMDIIKGLYISRQVLLDAPPLKFLSEFQLESFFEVWIAINADTATIPLEAMTLSSNNKNLMRDHLAYALARDLKVNDAWNSLESLFDTNALADLNALYETGNSPYAEHYPFHVEYYQDEFKNGIYNYSGGAKEAFGRLLKKPGTLVRILRTLYLVGHGELAERLIRCYSIEASMEWLSSARQYDLFIEPCGEIIISCFEFYKTLKPMSPIETAEPAI